MIKPHTDRVQLRPKYTKDKPSNISTSPNLLKVLLGDMIILLTQVFILSGKAKYGRPSMIITIPITHKKNSIRLFPGTFPARYHGAPLFLQ